MVGDDAGTAGNHALSAPYATAQSNGAVEEMFDGIEYGKGAAIIAQAIMAFGVSEFDSAIAAYIKEHAFGNTIANDIWSALAEAANDPEALEKMASWTYNKGYPLLSVTFQTSSKSLVLSQKPFVSKRVAEAASPKAEKLKQLAWWIPCRYSLDGGSTTAMAKVRPEEAKGQQTAKIPSTLASTSPCLLANVGRRGYFRVNYDDEGWACWSENPSAFAQLSTMDRAGMMADVFHIARASYLPSGVEGGVGFPLVLARAVLPAEREYSIFSQALSGFGELELVLRPNAVDGNNGVDAECRTAFDKLVLGAVQPATQALGWDPAPGNSALDNRLRRVLLATAASAGDAAIVAEATKRFKASLPGANPSQVPLDPETASVIMSIAVRHGGQDEWDGAVSIYNRNGATAAEKSRALGALAQTKDLGRLRQLLDSALPALSSTSIVTVRPQDVPRVIENVASTAEGFSVAWAFVKERWDDVFATFGKGGLI